MTQLFKNKNIRTRAVSIVALVSLFFALSVSGALGGFWRAVYNNPLTALISGNDQFQYGYGYGALGWGYGYGYGYGYANDEGYYFNVNNDTTDYSDAITLNDSNKSTVISSISTTTASGVALNRTVSFAYSGANVVIPAGTTISGSGIDVNQIIQITATGSTQTLTGSVEQKGALKFGLSNTTLNFSKPVQIQIPVTGFTGATIKVQVKHFGGVFGTSGLTNSNTALCSNGVATPLSDIASVSGGFATIYTCSASDFVAYTEVSTGGGSSSSSSSSSSSGGGGGGGGASISMDSCPTGDASGSYYDGRCTPKVTTPTGSGSTSTGSTTVVVDTNQDTGVVTITKPDGTKVTFSDISTSFAKNYIAELSSKGIISGYADGTFKPQQNASRAEFLKITLRGMGIDYSNADVSKLTFADVDKNSWVAKAVVKAVELGLVDPSNKNFRPNDSISRAESMKMLLVSAGVTVGNSTTTDFSDVSGWAVKYVQKAKELGIVNGQMINGKLVFRPNDSISRAEVSKIVVLTMKLDK